MRLRNSNPYYTYLACNFKRFRLLRPENTTRSFPSHAVILPAAVDTVTPLPVPAGSYEGTVDVAETI